MPQHGRCGTLYIASTPIGDMEDITLRALRVLRSVDLIIAEDTRQTRRLLDHYNVEANLIAVRAGEADDALCALRATLEAGKDAAFVCDAGTPLIADPGRQLVQYVLEMAGQVTPLPGACAAIAALTVSGLNTQRFTFEGFPPRGRSDRISFFRSIAAEPRTLVLYESHSHLLNTLRLLASSCGCQRRGAVLRNLTRSNETALRGTLQDILDALSPSPPVGEYVIVVEAASRY